MIDREYVYCDICEEYFVVTLEQDTANCPQCEAPFRVRLQ